MEDGDPAPPRDPTAAVVAGVTGIPGVRETISGALDLAVGSSRRVRTLSVYCGLLVLALVGPAIVEFFAIVRSSGSLDGALNSTLGGGFEPREPASISLLRLAFLGAFVGVFGVLIEASILVTAALGAAASGRRIELRGLLHLSRRVFWSVVGAALLVGILSRVTEIAVEWILQPKSLSAYESVYIVQVVATTIITAPFAFWMAGIVIGGVGAIEALRRSTRIAARRWRLAILVASAGAVLGIIEIFALGAGFDLLARLSTALGLQIEGTTLNGVVTTTVTLAGVVATSSLLVTVAGLVAAPQVFVFIRMTGYTGGLDRAVATASAGQPPNRLITVPMRALIGFVGLAAVGGLLSLNGP
jgi:hypothetical protein